VTLRWKILGGSAVAAAVSSVAIALATERMLLDPGERNMLLVVILGGFALGVLAASMLSRRLVGDLENVAAAAQAVGEGDLSVRTHLTRRDELGTTARAFDEMVAELEETARRREAAEEERRLLVASISHDLRTPIAAIRAALEAVEDGVGDTDRLLAAAQCDVRALTGLVDDLFLLAQIDAGRYEPECRLLDPAEVVDEAVEALLPTAAASGVRIAVRTTAPLRVLGAERELGRVIRNLLDNAIRHAPPGTEVTVDVVADTQGGNGTPRVSVTVSDQGPGFDRALLATAAEPFVRGDASRNRATGGAGLGLAIATGVVRAHGGELSLRAGPGGQVEIALPAAPTT
jgi:signal transduction histidine kinase